MQRALDSLPRPQFARKDCELRRLALCPLVYSVRWKPPSQPARTDENASLEQCDSLVRHGNNRKIWINVRDRFLHPYIEADARN